MTQPAVKHHETLLVVDDSENTREVLQRNLTREGFRVFTSPDVAGALHVLEHTAVDLVITDLKMPKVGGLDLVRHVRENLKDIEVMMITGYPTIQGAVQAVKTGVEEYLAKPFTDEELLTAVNSALSKLHARRSGNSSSRNRTAAPDGLIGESTAMREIHDAIDKAVHTSATAMICGESGTGKELVARAIHYRSDRSSAPFVPVNCASIPEGLLESELFGHVKGAFTGATESQAGFFLSADGGTVFLDEIGEMSLAMQAKLLRVLQDKEVRMVGSNRTRKIDVRILAASNKDLAHLVSRANFREDLYYRLNVIAIEIPPLRERENDILLLAREFVARFAKELGKPIPVFSDGALEVLRNYAWPGNVRELENVIQRIVVMSSESIIDVPDLPSLMRFTTLRDREFTRTLAEVELEYISNVLAHVKGNKTMAAKILGIDRKTLREKVSRQIPPA